MRVLFARAGIPYSPFTGKPITSQTITQIVDKIKELPKKTTIYLYAPVVRGRKGEYKKDILNYKKRGFRKIKIDEKLYEIDKIPELNKNIKHDMVDAEDKGRGFARGNEEDDSRSAEGAYRHEESGAGDVSEEDCGTDQGAWRIRQG